MSVKALAPFFGPSGALIPVDGATLSYGAAFEADLVQRGVAAYVTKPTSPGNRVPVEATIGDGRIRKGVRDSNPLVIGGANARMSYRQASPSLPLFGLALKKAIHGLGDARVLVVGHSWASGSGASGVTGYNNARIYSMPVQLAELIDSNLAPANGDSFFGCALRTTAGDYQAFDPRAVTVSGWTPGVTLNNAMGGVFNSTTDGAVLSIKPVGKWDRAKVWYAQSGSQGNFNVRINSDADTAVVGAGASAFANVTVSASAVGYHTLTLTKVGTTANNIVAFEFWDSTESNVRVMNMSWPGGKISNVANSGAAWDGLNAIQNLAPDLTIITCAINDWNAGTAIGAVGTAGSYIDNVYKVIQKAKLSGDCLIISDGPSAVANYASLATQQTYVDALATLASAQGCVFVDTWRKMVSYEAAGVFYTDGLHHNAAGYNEVAQAILSAIAQ